MSIKSDDDRMRPILIIPPGDMSAEDIKRLNDNGICTVEAKNPSMVKFLDPIPSAAQRTKVEEAAIALSRKMLTQGFWHNGETRGTLAAHYVDLLVKGTPLDPKPSQTEQERVIFDDAKAAELRKLAQAEAAEERRVIREVKSAEKEIGKKSK